ncbi:DUF1501 domain-containing protein [Agaribacter flavus]|uniref:DUF1501 domain-containing protein n=1 Tax=Agaribacter flavus TaxID=1902781 RepID=A0ABV7FK92_9ALTE
MRRRDFIKSSAASLVLLSSMPASGFWLSDKKRLSKTQNKVIWVFLRGAMDGLSALAPTADPDFKKYREAYYQGDKTPLLPLSSGFALDPNLSFFHQSFLAKELSAVVAVASAYRKRSHFDAQDQMESGLDDTNHESGWLARALSVSEGQALAIAHTTPIALKGGQVPHTWYPSSLDKVDDDLLKRLKDMYQNDSLLLPNITAAISQSSNESMMSKSKKRANFTTLASECGRLLSSDQNLRCAMLEMGGWDTHNNQKNRLSRQFTQLNDGMENLKDSLGSDWENTLVFISTEFGRTVAMNGTKGTDHGSASTMFVLGGALKHKNQLLSGGQVYGQWLGLAQLLQGRDLMPSSDIRYWLSRGLQMHWGLKQAQINQVFPDLPPLA